MEIGLSSDLTSLTVDLENNINTYHREKDLPKVMKKISRITQKHYKILPQVITLDEPSSNQGNRSFVGKDYFSITNGGNFSPIRKRPENHSKSDSNLSKYIHTI